MTRVDELVVEATQRAYEQALVNHGREPTTGEVAMILFQSQLAVLASAMYGEDLHEFWADVISVIRGTVTPDEAS